MDTLVFPQNITMIFDKTASTKEGIFLFVCLCFYIGGLNRILESINTWLYWQLLLQCLHILNGFAVTFSSLAHGILLFSLTARNFFSQKQTDQLFLFPFMKLIQISSFESSESYTTLSYINITINFILSDIFN